jgi:hypothetical protein
LPATGTPASPGATPSKLPATLEEALAELAKVQQHATNKEQEASRHGKNLSAIEKELAAYKEKERLAQEATLSEIDRAKKQALDLQQKYEAEHKAHVNALVKLAAASKGIIDPDIAALAIEPSLEFDESGMPSNLDKALDDLVKSKPYLAAKPNEAPATPAQTARPPQVPPMNPGRTTIQPSAPQGPFQPTRLTDVFKRP